MVMLTIALGSLDGKAGEVISAIASRLVSLAAPVRLSVVETGSTFPAASAFSSGKVDLDHADAVALQDLTAVRFLHRLTTLLSVSYADRLVGNLADCALSDR